MTDRIELRELVVAALKGAATMAGDRVYSSRTLPTTSLNYPALMVQSGPERKASLGPNGAQQFTTTATIAVTARVENTEMGGLEEDLGTIGLQIEKAVINDYDLTQKIQQIASVSSRLEMTPEGRSFMGDLFVNFDLEFYQGPEDFAPIETQPFEGVDLHADMAAPFDASGTYENPAFPDSVQAAPRTSGPDGRDEAGLKIDLPQ